MPVVMAGIPQSYPDHIALNPKQKAMPAPNFWARGKPSPEDAADFAQDLAPDRAGIVAMSPGGFDKPIPRDDVAFIKIGDRPAQPLDGKPVYRHARPLGGAAQAVHLATRIGCAVAGHVDDVSLAIGPGVEMAQRVVQRLGRGRVRHDEGARQALYGIGEKLHMAGAEHLRPV